VEIDLVPERFNGFSEAPGGRPGGRQPLTRLPKVLGAESCQVRYETLQNLMRAEGCSVPPRTRLVNSHSRKLSPFNRSTKSLYLSSTLAGCPSTNFGLGLDSLMKSLLSRLRRMSSFAAFK
jgi:hypothetical protein